MQSNTLISGSKSTIKTSSPNAFTSPSEKSIPLSWTRRLLQPPAPTFSLVARVIRLLVLTKYSWQLRKLTFPEHHQQLVIGRVSRYMSIWRLYSRDRLRWRGTSQVWSIPSSLSKTSWEGSPTTSHTTLSWRTPRRHLTNPPWREEHHLTRQSKWAMREAPVDLEELFLIQWF